MTDTLSRDELLDLMQKVADNSPATIDLNAVFATALAVMDRFDLLRAAVNEWPGTCAPDCDSFGHGERCTSGDPAEGLIGLRAKCAQLEGENAALTIELATRLCELGYADDPRVSGMGTMDMAELARRPAQPLTVHAAAPLTYEQARPLVTALLSSAGRAPDTSAEKFGTRFAELRDGASAGEPRSDSADAERLDAIERGDVEVECMGTTIHYQNVYNSRGDMYSTAGGGLTLREAIDKALGVTERSEVTKEPNAIVREAAGRVTETEGE